ncbi:DedA family protein [Corynebacterium sp. A21]|uniref:DedA family protein n=1 Tax=Corynebacterium sp. A21 TaxID=3457318 RepID=UPI003FD405C3
MTDQFVSWVETLMSAAAFYPVLSLVVIMDSLIPLIPSETVISLAGAWSGSRGTPNLFLVLIVATLSAIVGDNLCYFFGTRLIGFVNRIPGNSKRGKALHWTRKNLNERDVSTIIIARFIPWARWFVTITLGSVGYSWRRFLLWDSIGALVWAAQATLLGYLGGWLFRDQPLIGLVVGASFGILFGMALQRLQRTMERRREARKAS